MLLLHCLSELLDSNWVFEKYNPRYVLDGVKWISFSLGEIVDCWLILQLLLMIREVTECTLTTNQLM